MSRRRRTFAEVRLALKKFSEVELRAEDSGRTENSLDIHLKACNVFFSTSNLQSFYRPPKFFRKPPSIFRRPPKYF